MKIGIMGCGVISKQYIQDIQRLYRELEICMVADVHSGATDIHPLYKNIISNNGIIMENICPVVSLLVAQS